MDRAGSQRGKVEKRGSEGKLHLYRRMHSKKHATKEFTTIKKQYSKLIIGC